MTTTTSNIVMNEIVGDITLQKIETFDVDFAMDILKNADLSKDDRDTLRRYVKARVRGNQVEVFYKLGKEVKSYGLGRWNAVKGLSLQGMPRDIRSALARKHYFDVDIVNAVFTIMSQYAKKNGLSVPEIDRYIIQREEILEKTSNELNITRDEAKKIIAGLMNGASADGLTAELKVLHKEIRNFIELNWNWNKDEFKFLAKVPNYYGKAMAYKYQTIERSILEAMDNAFSRRGRSMDVLIHDGGLVRRKEYENELPLSLLREIEDEVYDKTKYRITLTTKPMTTSYTRVTENASDDYNHKKKLWEETGYKGDVYFKLRHPPSYIAVSGNSWEQLSRGDLIQNEEDNQLSDGSSFIKKWFEDPNKREYNRMVFLPGKEANAGDYNLFRGFPFKSKEGDWSLMKQLLNIVVNNDANAYEWMENWIASIIQRPWKKTNVCVVIQGKKGAGKDTFFNALMTYLFGKEYSFNTSTPEYNVFGKFNKSMARVLFLKFEEANYQVNNTNNEQLKSLITGETINIEKKGHDAITLDNFVNLVMTTNNEIPVSITDDERRYMLVKASDEYLGNVEFWKSVYKQLEEHGQEIMNAYAYHLLHKDLSNWSPFPAYRTQYYYDVMSASIPYHAKFFQRVCELNGNTGDMTYTSQRLLQELQQQNLKFEINATRLGITLRDLYIEAGVIVKFRRTIGFEYTIHCDMMKEYLEKKHWWVDV